MNPPIDIEYMNSLGLQNDSFKTSSGSEVFYYYKAIASMRPNLPVLVLIHGYPQTSYMWRHFVENLPKFLTDIPLFIPDIPGYGRSSPIQTGHDKRTVGRAILEALKSLIGSDSAILIAGHDRGARICHRLAVDANEKFGNFNIRGVILLDIVPTLVQWQTFGESKSSMNSFHWPLLANVGLATSMIMAQGGDEWCRNCLNRWMGANPLTSKLIHTNDSFKVYCYYMAQESVIRATCEDYRAGAGEDVQMQEQDQAAGRKLTVDTLIIYSVDYLGSRYNIKEVWDQWSLDPAKVQICGIDGDCGHFIAEEAPIRTVDAIAEFYIRMMSV